MKVELAHMASIINFDQTSGAVDPTLKCGYCSTPTSKKTLKQCSGCRYA